jgi:hypothetical protein
MINKISDALGEIDYFSITPFWLIIRKEKISTRFSKICSLIFYLYLGYQFKIIAEN